MLKVEHIGIAVQSLSKSIPLFESLLNCQVYKTELVATEQVRTAFLRKADTKIELLEATVPESPIARYLEKKGEGIHHLAFEVADIRQEMERLQHAGFTLLNQEPKKGADGKLVCFLHPKQTNGLLVELCQQLPETVV